MRDCKYQENNMPAKKKTTRSIKQTDRQAAHEAAQAQQDDPNLLCVRLSPVQMQQLQIIAAVANNDTPEEYAKKVINRHIADRLYLVRK